MLNISQLQGVQSAVEYARNNSGNSRKDRRRQRRQNGSTWWQRLGNGIGDLFGGAVDSLSPELQKLQLPTVQTEVGVSQNTWLFAGVILAVIYFIFNKK